MEQIMPIVKPHKSNFSIYDFRWIKSIDIRWIKIILSQALMTWQEDGLGGSMTGKGVGLFIDYIKIYPLYINSK